ncbi:MAG TPA: tRNA lysidine(34) synthetase TilS [Acidimicrobiia bacterium]|nr:tRNA lysidine(34) synthetase TilS [Acidimicrobiia bacterium]
MPELASELAPWVAALVAVDDLVDDPDGPVVVACSGGADSLALLALARAIGLDVVAVYVDHGLRASSARDGDVVADAARRLGARALVRAVDVVPGGNLEARARDLRYAALDAARRDVGARVVLVGHTLDDQAETVVLNVVRGSGLDGIAGMAPVRGAIRRPLLRLRRADTVEICRRCGLAPVADAMNDDPAFRRVQVRRSVLPQLETLTGTDLAPVLARQADIARDDLRLLDGLASAARGALGDPPDAAALAALDVALARRVVRAWLGAPPPSQAVVDAVLAVAAGRARAVEIGRGRRVERSGGRLHLVAAPAARPPTPVVLPVPGVARVEHVEFDARVHAAAPTIWPHPDDGCVLDAELAGARLVVRPVEPGDRLRPLGGRGTRRVVDVLREGAVAASRRSHHLVVTAPDSDAVPDGAVLWVVGYRIDHRVRVTERTRSFLSITLGACA